MKGPHPKLAAVVVLVGGLGLALFLAGEPLARALARPLPPVSSGAILTAEEPGLDALLFSSVVGAPLQCADGIDNDDDGFIDLADRGCVDAWDLWEEDPIKVRRREVSFEGLADGNSQVTEVRADDISDDGSVVVGEVLEPIALWRRVFRWEEGVLEVLPGETPAGTFGSDIFPGKVSVSGDGRVVVVSTRPHALRLEDGIWTEVESPKGESRIWDVNADGSVLVGWVGTQTSSSYGWPARWDDGEVTLLSPGPRNILEEIATKGVSADGTVAVGMSERQAVRWVGTDPRPFLLSDDAPPGDPSWPGRKSWASAASADGSVIVGTRLNKPHDGPVWTAYRWDDGDIVDLGNGWVNDVSDDGQIAVGSGPSIWDGSGNHRNLTDMLVNDYRLDLGGWELRDATGISGDGRTVIGWGKDPDGFDADWVLRLPEACNDGLDNDGDGLVDFGDDPGCVTRLADSETELACGIGFELVFALPPVLWWRRRRAHGASR